MQKEIDKNIKIEVAEIIIAHLCSIGPSAVIRHFSKFDEPDLRCEIYVALGIEDNLD